MQIRRAARAALFVALFAFTNLAGLAPLAHAATAALPAGITKGPALGGISEYRLANGLKVLLVPDPSLETVTVNVTYLVGSRHEGYGEYGMAHLLEHLMFKGTPHHPNIKNDFTKRGARYNGTTSFDRTNYFETLSAGGDSLAFALAMEADRMVNSYISKKDLDSEMTVVRNEFESGENNPYAVLRNQTLAAAFQWHNYGHPVIGNRADIENVPIARLQAFYHRYYQPDNAVLVIGGKFDESAALKLAAQTFGRIPKPSRVLIPTYTTEPTQNGEHDIVVRRVGNVQIVSALYHMPPGTHPDYAAVDLLVSVLSNQPSGRLHKALVESGKASSIFGDDEQQREGGWIYVGATVPQDKPVDVARDALIETVEGFAAHPVTAEEVERARTRALNQFEQLMNDSRGLAITLSEFIALGDWRLVFWYRDRIAAVTTEDVQRVATTYLKRSNRTVGLFMPTATPDRAEIPAPPDLAAELKGYHTGTQIARGEAFDPTPEHIEARVIRRTLPGGMKLALLPKKTRGGTVIAQLNLRWGDEASKANRAEACSLAGAMLSRGTTKHTRAELRDALDKLKAHVSVGLNGASIDTVRANLPGAFELVAEMLRTPSFPAQEFEELKRSLLTGIDSQRSDPSALAALEITRYLNPWPADHWYYTPTLDERAARVRATSLDDVRRCHDELVGASDATLSVVGDFDPAEITAVVDKLFGDWKSPRPYHRIPMRYFDIAAADRTINTPDKANAIFRAGLNLPLRDDDPDFPALVLGNYLLGGSTDARLTRRIREKEGLSYGVGSWLTAGAEDAVGEFGVYAIYAPQNRDRVESLVRSEIHDALDEGFPHEEVETAKRGLLHSRQIARSQDGNLAGRLAAYLEIDRTFRWDTDFEARIAKLSPTDVQEALRRHLDPAKLTVVKAGDFKGSSAKSAGK